MHSRGTMHLGINRFSAVAVVLTGLASLVGCKDQEKCTEALQTARQAMQDEYLDMALTCGQDLWGRTRARNPRSGNSRA